MSENPGKAVIPHRPHVFPIACWALGLVGFSELIVGGLALAARMEDSKQIRVIEKEVQKIITVEVPAKRADGDDASVVARPPGVNPAPPLPVAPVMPEPTPIDAPKIADPIAEKLVGEGRKARVNGDMGLAILKLTESLKQAPDDPSVLYELGLVHEAMGIYDQAAAYYQKVFEKGVSGAGALYELSAKKLSDGFEQPADLLGKLALGRVRIFKDPREDNQRVILTIPVQKDPTSEIDLDEIEVSVLFFNRTTKGEIVQLEDKSWVTKQEWTTLPFDWIGGEESLRVTYVIPSQDNRTEHLFGQQTHYGQVVSLTYKGEVLDVWAWPRDLAARVAQPSAAPGQQKVPEFSDLPPDINMDAPLLPRPQDTPDVPPIDSLPPLPKH